jgi:AcrR family transcriptional regulator
LEVLEMKKKRAVKLRQSERTELSDQRMINKAIEMLLQHGMSGLRLTHVGVRAGYSRGLAAMRFGSRQGLLRRVAKHLGQRWIETLTEALRDKSGLAAIYAAIDTQEHWLTVSPRTILGQYLIFFHSMDPGAAGRLNAARVVVAQRRDLSRWIREAVAAGEVPADTDPEAEAGSILSSMIGIIFQALMDPEVSASTLCRRLKSEIAARLAVSPARRNDSMFEVPVASSRRARRL